MQSEWLLCVNGALYLAVFTGVFLVFGAELGAFASKLRVRHHLRARKRELVGKNSLEQHLDRVLTAALSRPASGLSFLWASILLFLLTGFLAMQSLSLPAAFSAGAMAAASPYLLIRIRLETKRKKNSFEGEAFVSAFLSNYRICNFNIFEAMEQTAAEKRDTNCGKLMYRMLFTIRNTADKERIRAAAEGFAFAVNTNWSRMLGTNLALAAESGINVAPALEDILIQLREARSVAEERKRLNAEASKMVLFLIPALYLVTIGASYHTIGITPARLIRNQFFTAEGFILLSASIFLFLANLVFVQIVNNQKFDY